MTEILLTEEFYNDLAEEYGKAMAQKGSPTEYISLWEWSKERIAKAAQLKLLKVLEEERKLKHKTRVDRVKMAVVCTSTCWLCNLKEKLK